MIFNHTKNIMTKKCQLWSVSPRDTKHARENGQNNESLY